MSESHSEIRYFTAEDTDDFITGWYRVSDGERIGERLDLPPPPPLAFSPARTEPVIPSFSGIFSDGVYADPTLGFSPFSPEEDEKVEVKQTVSIFNPLLILLMMSLSPSKEAPFTALRCKKARSLILPYILMIPAVR